jgi:inosine-uridine nucleoside N-ribohydrolase
MSTARRIVIDCDPGIDDAAALLLAIADPDTGIAAITCVHGNKPVDVTTANARRILDLAGRHDIPVHRGAERPLLLPAKPDDDYYGHDGLGDIGLPPPSRQPDAHHAVDLLVETVMTEPPGTIWVCAIGPLTNVALAMRLENRFAGRLAGLIVMGGDVAPGAPAEFNIGTDPAAVDVVFRSEAPLTLVPYNVTRAVHATAETLSTLAASGSKAANAVAGMQQTRDPAGSALHDALALATLFAPDLFEYADGTVTVEWRDAAHEGETVFTPSAGGRHRVVTGLDATAFERLLIKSLAKLD